MMDSKALPDQSGIVRPEYHRRERQWYLWDGHEAVRDEHGAIRLFLTAKDAYDWQAASDDEDRR